MKTLTREVDPINYFWIVIGGALLMAFCQVPKEITLNLLFWGFVAFSVLVGGYTLAVHFMAMIATLIFGEDDTGEEFRQQIIRNQQTLRESIENGTELPDYPPVDTLVAPERSQWKFIFLKIIILAIVFTGIPFAAYGLRNSLASELDWSRAVPSLMLLVLSFFIYYRARDY